MGRVLGTALSWNCGAHCSTLGLVMVAPEMQGQRIGERGAASDALEHVRDDGAEARARRQLALDGQCAVERHAGFDQRGQLLGEGEDVAAGDSPTAARGPGEAKQTPARVLGDDGDGEVRVLLQPIDHGPRVGRLHDTVDGLAAPIPCAVREDRHARSRPP